MNIHGGLYLSSQSGVYLYNDGTYIKASTYLRAGSGIYSDGWVQSAGLMAASQFTTNTSTTFVQMIYNGVHTVQNGTNYALELQSAYHGAPNGQVIIGSGGAASPSLTVYGPVYNSAPSQGYIALSGLLSGYADNTYGTLKTNGSCLYFDAAGTYTGYICYNAGFVDVSDERLKKNIVTVDNALEKLSQIKGVTFNWKDNRDNERHMGVLAQDVEKVAPELVVQPEGIKEKAVFYGGLTALTIEAIKEQQIQIVSLQSITTDFISKFKEGLIETKKLIVDGVDILKKLNELSLKVESQQKQIDELKRTIENRK